MTTYTISAASGPTESGLSAHDAAIRIMENGSTEWSFKIVPDAKPGFFVLVRQGADRVPVICGFPERPSVDQVVADILANHSRWQGQKVWAKPDDNPKA